MTGEIPQRKRRRLVHFTGPPLPLFTARESFLAPIIRLSMIFGTDVFQGKAVWSAIG
jgi:hypothetical protein